MSTTKRERTKAFTVETVKELRDRLAELMEELNGFVQQFERAQGAKPEPITLIIDGGEMIHDAERDFIKWLGRINSELRVDRVPKSKVTNGGELNGDESTRKKRAKR